jgi:hypothetical protein
VCGVFLLRWAAGGGVMGLTRRWSVESKDFEMKVKDGETELLIQERSKGVLRSVRMGSKEIVWLLHIF